MIDLSQIFDNKELSSNEDGSFVLSEINEKDMLILIKKISKHKLNQLDSLQDFILLGEDLDVEDLIKSHDYIFYSKCYELISKIDISNESHLTVLRKLPTSTFKISLDILILYFESWEEYEKCAFLKRIFDILEE